MEQTSKLRRKVLRGSLAAPVVLTVSSASAAAGSFGRCLANSPTTTNAAFFTTSADSWYRVQVPVTQLWAQGMDLGWYYNDPVKNVFVKADAPYTTLNFNSTTQPAYVKTGTAGSRWALVWFDRKSATRYSRITFQQPYGYSACTMSCYGSFSKA